MKNTVLNIVRAILVAAGGYIVGKGWLTNEALNDAVGAVLTLVGVVWTAVAHKQALETPVVPTKA